MKDIFKENYMHLLWVPVGLAIVYFLACQGIGRHGKRFGTDMLVSFMGVPLLTRGKYRWNELLTVREQRPYVGTRDAYIEGRAATYLLFGFLVVWFNQRRIEIPMNRVISVMCVGDSIDGKALDRSFPGYLSYPRALGKGASMLSAGL
jgi:hypothetical protein